MLEISYPKDLLCIPKQTLCIYLFTLQCPHFNNISIILTKYCLCCMNPLTGRHYICHRLREFEAYTITVLT